MKAILLATQKINKNDKKSYALGVIKELPDEIAIRLIEASLNKKTPLGAIFWMKRGFLSPDYGNGYLKTLEDMLEDKIHYLQQKNNCEAFVAADMIFFRRKGNTFFSNEPSPRENKRLLHDETFSL